MKVALLLLRLFVGELGFHSIIVQGKPVEMQAIAKDLAKISTVSNFDAQAVLGDIVGMMHTRMAQGKSVHITDLGYFRYTLDTVGVDSDQLKWIELSPDTKDSDPVQDDDDKNVSENPLG